LKLTIAKEISPRTQIKHDEYAIKSEEDGSMDEIQSLTSRVQQLGNAVDFWNRWMLWGLVFAALAAIWIGLTTRLTIVRSKQLAVVQASLDKAKEGQLALELKEKDRQIAEVKSESDQKTAGLQARAREADARIAESQRGSAEANERAKKAQASLSLAEQHSAEANAKAEGFRLDIAKANESAAKAQAQVAGAMAEAAKANLELERLRTPRSLNALQQSRIATVLRQFPGQQFSLSVNPDTESIDFMNVIESLFKSSGWVNTTSQIGDIQVGDAGTAYFSGVFLDVSPDEIDELRPTILTVSAALTAEGIPATPRTNVQLVGKKPKTINVGIGKKP
jgi:hypothetical protein